MSHFLYEAFYFSDQRPTPAFQAQLAKWSPLHEKVCQTMGEDFFDALWYFHSKLSEVEAWGAFLLAIRLTRAVLEEPAFSP